ncbi:hypothetical protein F4819DRAFT_482308 [Hypoxylon fuscum]|nr:hypothetical protein F4819DRAFT_482308 [Hypoxylon fuscum]
MRGPPPSAKTVPEEAPFPFTDADRLVLSLTDEEYQCHDWEDMKSIIGQNNLSVLKRKPSDLRRYLNWTSNTKMAFGSVTNYLLECRLPKTWGSPPFMPASTILFDDPSDYRVLRNDWPYGLTPNLTHIVVWSRTTIPTDPETGDMTPESRRSVGKFVKNFFADKLGLDGDDKVLWFKNWVALQSVRTLEHIHVIIRDVEKDILDAWTKELDCHRL